MTPIYIQVSRSKVKVKDQAYSLYVGEVVHFCFTNIYILMCVLLITWLLWLVGRLGTRKPGLTRPVAWMLSVTSAIDRLRVGAATVVKSNVHFYS